MAMKFDEKMNNVEECKECGTLQTDKNNEKSMILCTSFHAKKESKESGYSFEDEDCGDSNDETLLMSMKVDEKMNNVEKFKECGTLQTNDNNENQ